MGGLGNTGWVLNGHHEEVPRTGLSLVCVLCEHHVLGVLLVLN